MPTKFTAIFGALLLLTACGQTGPLYLPEHGVAVVHTPPPSPPPNIQSTAENHE